MPAQRSSTHSPSSSRSVSPRRSPRPAAEMDWTPAPSDSPRPEHSSSFSTAPLPPDLFTREYLEPAHYLQPGTRFSNSPEPPQYHTHFPPPPVSRPQLRHHHQHPHPPRQEEQPASRAPAGGNYKVYEVFCLCGMRLSDRGMKAVLLLKPHITLYSTDCMPSSTGTLSEADEPASMGARPAERTCDCLTQGIGCLCCGALVGYHILNPCDQCTGSQQQTRSANGHRFVFHQKAVYAKERLYTLGQAGLRAPSPSASFCLSRSVSPGPSQSSQHHLPDLAADDALHAYLAATSAGRKSTPAAPAFADDGSLRLLDPTRSHAPVLPLLQRGSQPADLAPGQNVYWRHLVTGGDLKPALPSSAAAEGRRSFDRRNTADRSMLCRLALGFATDQRPIPTR